MAIFILVAWTALVLFVGWQVREPLQARVRAYAERAQVTRALRQLSESSHEVHSLVKVIDQATFETYLSVINDALERERAGQQLTEGRVQELSKILQELNSKTQQLKGLAAAPAPEGRRAGEP